MGYYQAGDPGIFDFFENTAKSIFSSGSRAMGGEWKAKPGQLSLGRVVKSYIQPIASMIPGFAPIAAGISTASDVYDAADSVGSLLSHSPSEEKDYDDMATYSGMDPETAVEAPYEQTGIFPGTSYPPPEMPLTLSSPDLSAPDLGTGFTGGLAGLIQRDLAARRAGRF